MYEDLDPGCCVVAEDSDSGTLLGSCFYHPRETHVSLGIMNSHPDSFGQGVAVKLLRHITDFADREGKPVRLVSSAMNLDSFSLYNRHGFVPRLVFQDMFAPVPDNGLTQTTSLDGRVREATLADVPAMVALEEELVGIRREKDYRYFIENRRGVWHASVIENDRGKIDGFLVSIYHPGSNMLGPGVMRTEEQATALILRELNHHAGRYSGVSRAGGSKRSGEDVVLVGGAKLRDSFRTVPRRIPPADGHRDADVHARNGLNAARRRPAGSRFELRFSLLAPIF